MCSNTSLNLRLNVLLFLGRECKEAFVQSSKEFIIVTIENGYVDPVRDVMLPKYFYLESNEIQRTAFFYILVLTVYRHVRLCRF